ncbi:hypothetical protein GGF31_008792 [Allomyces arbusculus]|nr:hypothetical protein GGF31_008792 [Allomyces arbusculus]
MPELLACPCPPGSSASPTSSPMCKDPDTATAGAATPPPDAAPKSLRERLLAPATVTTLEVKYATHPRVAEFYCTITSLFFALPLLLYYTHRYDPVECEWPAAARTHPPVDHAVVPHWARFPVMTEIAIALSVLAAIASTLYHATLVRVLSTCDACVAVTAFYVHTMALVWAGAKHAHGVALAPPPTGGTEVVESVQQWIERVVLGPVTTWLAPLPAVTPASVHASAGSTTLLAAAPSRTASSLPATVATAGRWLAALHHHVPHIDPVWAAGVVTAATAGAFLWTWEATAKPALLLMAGVFPLNFAASLDLDEYLALAFGLAGIACFLLDRKKIAPLHPLWHLFGGLSLYFGLEETILVHRRYHPLPSCLPVAA